MLPIDFGEDLMTSVLTMRRTKAAVATLLTLALAVLASGLGTVQPAQAEELYSISGRVGYEGGGSSFGLGSAWIQVYRAGSSEIVGWGGAEHNGDYAVNGLPAGDYEVRFSDINDRDVPSLGYAAQWYGGTAYRAEAATISLTDASVRADIVLPKAGGIEGYVDAPWAGTTQDVMAWAYLVEPDGSTFLAGGWGGTSGNYLIGGLASGTYVVKFSNGNNGMNGAAYRPEFWSDAPTISAATDIAVVQGTTTSGIDAALELWEPRFLDRFAGQDRFEAAAAMSSATFEPEVPVVFVADGLNFPDALSAGPAAAKLGGPVLLVTPSGIPPATRAELARLRPGQIVVVGGTGSVGDGVLSELRGISPNVIRVAGQDRYETSRNLAIFAFSDAEYDLDVLFADGRGFADALSAGSAAASIGYPLILLDGASSQVNTKTSEVLAQLEPRHTWIIGGPAAVHSGTEASVRALGYGVQRIGGPDRFAVSAEVGKYFIGLNDSDIVFVATGYNFPDALAGVPVAAVYGASLFIVPSTCIPAGTIEVMRRFGYSNVILLGGPGALGAGVESMTPC